jgi:hypothetical protein
MNHSETKNHWEEELKKSSLKEPPFKSKFNWLRPITAMTKCEFRGKWV